MRNVITFSLLFKLKYDITHVQMMHIIIIKSISNLDYTFNYKFHVVFNLKI